MSAPENALLPLRFEGIGFEQGGETLLEDINFSIEAGAISVILGPNGAGKTLLLRIANGLLAPTSGRVRWATTVATARAASALVFQRPVLLRRSARANVDFPSRVRGIGRRERERRTARALAGTQLTELAARPARRLSVGEQQRLALARAWALEPRLLFLDEPAAALDPAAGRLLENAIETLRDEGGVKIVMTTHDLAQARRLAGEVLFLHRGRLLEQSAATEFFARPQSAVAREFLKGVALI